MLHHQLIWKTASSGIDGCVFCSCYGDSVLQKSIQVFWHLWEKDGRFF